jgi:hypothetical protein
VSDLVKLRGDWHAETLASGRTIAPGEPFERSDLDSGDPGDKRLLDEGLIIDAVIAPVQLEGEDLQARAKELGIIGRSKMSADELREAIALAEPPPTATLSDDAPQRIGGGA